MRDCQLCGAKSWGPIEDRDKSAILTMPHFWGKQIDFPLYSKCDACGSIALSALIEKPLPDAEFTPGVHFGGPSVSLPPDPERMMAMLMGRMPIPETRLERIVRSMLEARVTGQNTEEWARWLVSAARMIESEMDREPEIKS
jgi:hypothetical protein